jgi:hypothetical protein
MKICSTCKIDHSEKGRHCARCREYFAGKSSGYAAKRRLLGLCIRCGEVPPEDGKATCRSCLAQARVFGAQQRAKKRVDGECRCGDLVVEGQRMCLPCINKMNLHFVQRRYKKKMAAIDVLGGACADCGLTGAIPDVYDFHHIDPLQKEGSVARMISTRPWDDVLVELAKCALLCSNCHRTRHAYIDKPWLKEIA